MVRADILDSSWNLRCARCSVPRQRTRSPSWRLYRASWVLDTSSVRATWVSDFALLPFYEPLRYAQISKDPEGNSRGGHYPRTQKGPLWKKFLRLSSKVQLSEEATCTLPRPMRGNIFFKNIIHETIATRGWQFLYLTILYSSSPDGLSRSTGSKPT